MSQKVKSPDRASGVKVVSLSEVTNAQAAEWLVDLAGDLRSTDYAEIKATSGEDPATALVSAVMVSTHAWVILADDDPIAAFGCAPSADPSSAVVWMLGSPRMDERANAIAILRLSRPYLDQMQTAYASLWNHIDARNDRSMKWLEWCGFRVLEAGQSFGVEGRLFFLFYKGAPPSV